MHYVQFRLLEGKKRVIIMATTYLNCYGMNGIFTVSTIFSLHNISAIEEIYKDACQWASSQGGSPKAACNASLAAAWLEAVFPSLISHSGGSSTSVYKAMAHIHFNASLRLQVLHVSTTLQLCL
jgi:hypothetical protein